MTKIKNKILILFYSSWIGCKYLEFLLWLDDQNSTNTTNYIGINRVVIEAQKVLYREGIIQIKRKVKSVLEARDKKEYDKALKELTDFLPLAERDSEEARKLREALYSVYVKKEKDIKTSTDYAKMIDTRIEDYKELQFHNEKRSLLKQIRKLRRDGELTKALEKEEEFKIKYGRF
jgi:hypothetical protein